MYSSRRKKRNQKRSISVASQAASIGSNALIASGALLVSQFLYMALTTPRLPPPDKSGHDFVPEGLVASSHDNADDDAENERSNSNSNKSSDSTSEFRLVLVGDSPIEGIGNHHHAETMGGQTALEFSKALQRPVRYWSFGKSGLTARGIQEEMVPYLEGLHETIRMKKLSRSSGDDIHTIDAVIICCGVNNVLSGHSPKRYGEEVRDLISSIRQICPSTTKVLVTELIDFAFLPFVPYPLSKVLSWHSKKLQKEMESIVSELQNQHSKGTDEDKHQSNHTDNKGEGGIAMSYLPKIEEMLKNPHESDVLIDLTYEEKKALTLEDLYADDKFHPAKLGNMVTGKVHVKTFFNIEA